MFSQTGCNSNELSESDDILDYLLGRWSMLEGNIDEATLSLAVGICQRFQLEKRYSELEKFLKALPLHSIYTTNETIVRAQIAVAFERKQYNLVYRLIKTHSFKKGEDLIEVWDKAHYAEYENSSGKPPSSLTRFRIRERHIPPASICPSRERKKMSLPIKAKEVLKEWFDENINDPYPTATEKILLSRMANITVAQVETWFANVRKRRLAMKCKNGCSLCWYHNNKPETRRGRKAKYCAKALHSAYFSEKPQNNAIGDYNEERKDVENKNEGDMENNVLPSLDKSAEPTLNHNHFQSISSSPEYFEGQTHESSQSPPSVKDNLHCLPKLDLVLPQLVNDCPFLNGLCHQTKSQEHLPPCEMLSKHTPYLSRPWIGDMDQCLDPAELMEQPNGLSQQSIFTQNNRNTYEKTFITPPSFVNDEATSHCCILSPDSFGVLPSLGVSYGYAGHILRLNAATALLDMSVKS